MAIRNSYDVTNGVIQTTGYYKNNPVSYTETVVTACSDNFQITADGMSTKPYVKPTAIYLSRRKEERHSGVSESWRLYSGIDLRLESRRVCPTGGLYNVTEVAIPDEAAALSGVAAAAVIAFYDDVADTGLNLAQDIAESPQTLRLTRDLIMSAIRAKRTLRRIVTNHGDIGKSKRAANAWLSYIYGVVPTLKTIHSLTEFTSREVNKVINVKGRVMKKLEYGYSGAYSRSQKLKYVIKYGGQLKVPDNDDLNRLTSLDPAVIAWELMPYSFVFDWFMDIGGMLAAMETRRRYAQYLSNCYKTISYKRVYKDKRSIALPNPMPSNVTKVKEETEGTSTRVVFSRSVLQTPPSVAVPKLGVPKMGLVRTANALALIIQKIF